MPSKRSSNAPKKRTSNQRGRAAAPKRGAASSTLTPVQGDIMGVVLAVVALSMVVAIVAPSSAVLTSAAHDLLALSFGAGALLVPVALFAFAMTFFFGHAGSVSRRVALGLALVVLAVLGMLSLNLPGADAAPDAVFDPAQAELAGGYVGGALAWALLSLVGPLVGNVVLAGVVVAGVVVCGFSISEAVAKARGALSEVAEEHHARVEARRAQRIIDAAADEEILAQEAAGQAAPSLFDDDAAQPTTFIGDRKTTVLKRGRAQLLDEDAAGAGEDGEPKTTLLSRRKRGRAAAAAADKAGKAGEPTGALFASDLEEDAAEVAAEVATTPAPKKKAGVPAFLQGKGSAPSAKAAKASAPAGERRSVEKAPRDITRPGDAAEGYELPSLSILRDNTEFDGTYANEGELKATASKLQGTLEEFGLTSKVEGWIAGPSVTTFKISMGEGERVNKIVNLEDDIALSLAAKSVRIFAPIPGTSLVGIEIPNEKPQPVYLSDVLPYAKGGPLDCAFGRDSEGNPIVVDLAGLPHLLVAGTTGSGKSVLLNAIIMSMLMRATPEQVRLIMVDPKRVEFTGYAGLPHLYVPVVTEPRQAASALQWGVTEMERRLKVFEHYRVRDIKTFNKNVDGDKYAEMENPPKHMPYFVIVIDELADLMMVAGKDVESSIVRIAQLGRAAGIHLIVATQRPSADVVTGLIRANIDNRVALSVDNSLNSRIILDQKGAEQLLGKGDMLVKLRGKKPRRAQGCWVSDEEIEECVKFVCGQVTADYHEDILTAVVPTTPGAPGEPGAPKDDDPLVWEAARIVVDSQLGSTSSLQRALSVGYARAGRIMDMLEAKGVVGPANGSKPREVLLDKEGLEDLQRAESDFADVLSSGEVE